MRTYTRIFIDAYKGFINYTFPYRKALEKIYNPSNYLNYIKFYTNSIVDNDKGECIYFTKWVKVQAFLEPDWGPKLSNERKKIYMP